MASIVYTINIQLQRGTNHTLHSENIRLNEINLIYNVNYYLYENAIISKFIGIKVNWTLARAGNKSIITYHYRTSLLMMKVLEIHNGDGFTMERMQLTVKMAGLMLQ